MRVESVNESTFGTFGGGLDNTMGPTSYNVQGKGPGYVYSILPLNNSLQQKVNQVSQDYYIYPGCMVRGKGVNNPDKHYTGIVNRIVKDSNGEIQFVYIKTLKTNRFVTVQADDIELIINSPAQDNSKFKEHNFTPSYNVNI